MQADRIGRYALGVAGAAVLAAMAYRYWPERASAAPASASAAPDPAAMVAQLEARLQREPGDADGWRMLGRSYFVLQRYAEAARAYAKATSLTPGDADSWSALGEALTLAGNGVSDDAAHAFRRALDADPRDARARYFLAVKRDLAGDHRGAVADWLALLQDAPPDAPYAASVRALVQTVAARERIDLAGRLPAAPTIRPPTDAIPGPDAAQMAAAAGLSPSQQDAMARGMVDRLAARLAANPRDATGWIRLMRARKVLGDDAAAKTALARARAAFAGDHPTLARFDTAARELGVTP